MTNQEAIQMLTAKVKCMQRETSGTDVDCNSRNCDDCELCYAQGTTGEQREALNMAISALQAQEEKTQLSAEGTTSDLISRQKAIDVCDNAIDLWHGQLGEGIVIAVKKKIEELPSAQPESEERKAESAQNVPIEDLISRKAAIDALWEIRQEEISDGRRFHDYCSLSTAVDVIKDLPSAQAEHLTDKEQRIFLAAMGREEKVCEEVDRNYVREPYEDSLVRVCKEIRRKVKGALWI